MFSLPSLRDLSPYPRHMDPPLLAPGTALQAYLHSSQKACKFKKRPSKRCLSKYSKHTGSSARSSRKAKKKDICENGASSASVSDIEEEDEEGATISKSQNGAKQKVVAAPMDIPRIDIVQPSPTIGSSPTHHNALARSPSMPATLPDQTPVYMSPQPFKPALTRPLTSPSLQGGESASVSAWGTTGANGTARVPLLPLPGTPALELTGHNFTPERDEAGAPLHTNATTDSQSVPVTFNFQDTITNRSSSLPGVQQQSTKLVQSQSQTDLDRREQFNNKDNKQIHPSRSNSLSSSFGQLTHDGRILRVTNPDPPSPRSSAAPSRTPSIGSKSHQKTTIAQKRFVSCPPAPLQVKRANDYKSSTLLSSPAGNDGNNSSNTPTSASNSASTPSFRFSDDVRSPASLASPTTSALSSLPATPTKLPSGPVRSLALAGDIDRSGSLYDSAQAALDIAKTTTPVPPTRTRQHKSDAVNPGGQKHGKKTRKLKRMKSTSSGDGDNSEGASQSCFESIGAPSEWERGPVTPRRKKYAHRRVLKQGIAPPSRESRSPSKSAINKRINTSKAQFIDASKAEHSDKIDEIREGKTEAAQVSKWPIRLSTPPTASKPNFELPFPGEALEGGTCHIATVWTPIGRVLIAPEPPTNTPTTMITATALPHASVSAASNFRPKNRVVSAPAATHTSTTRAFLIPPRSPRPPSTRMLQRHYSSDEQHQYHQLPTIRDTLSRSELSPHHRSSHYEPPSAATSSSRLAVPQPGCFGQQDVLRLSLPLPSPMRLDAFTTELLARCGVTYDPLTGLSSRRSSLSDEVAEMKSGTLKGIDNAAIQVNIIAPPVEITGVETTSLTTRREKAQPSPNDPFLATPKTSTSSVFALQQQQAHHMPATSSQRPLPIPGTESPLLSSSSPSSPRRPSLSRTHPVVLRPSTPVFSHHTTATPASCHDQAGTQPADELHEHTALRRSSAAFSSSSPPPALPPRPEPIRESVPHAEVLREQLVAQGAIVPDERSPTHLNQYSITNDRDLYNSRNRLHHHPLPSDTYQFPPRGSSTTTSPQDEGIIGHVRTEQKVQLSPLSSMKITIPPAFPDGVALMEYERARSLQEVQRKEASLAIPKYVQQQEKQALPPPRHPQTHVLHAEREKEREREKDRDLSMERHDKERLKSSFAPLQRMHADQGYERERGQDNRERERMQHQQQEYERGRRRSKEMVRLSNNNGLRVSVDNRLVHQHLPDNHEGMNIAREERGEEERIVGQNHDDGRGGGEGAIRLGEHKRGFNNGEIQKWLAGLEKARKLAMGEDEGEEISSIVGNKTVGLEGLACM